MLDPAAPTLLDFCSSLLHRWCPHLCGKIAQQSSSDGTAGSTTAVVSPSESSSPVCHCSAAEKATFDKTTLAESICLCEDYHYTVVVIKNHHRRDDSLTSA